MTASRFTYRIDDTLHGPLLRVFWPACHFPVSVRPQELRAALLGLLARQIEEMARQDDALPEITACILIARDELMERGIIAA